MDILITAVLNLLVSLDDLRIFESHKIQKKSPKGHIQTYFYLYEQVNPLCTLHLTSEVPSLYKPAQKRSFTQRVDMRDMLFLLPYVQVSPVQSAIRFETKIDTKNHSKDISPGGLLLTVLRLPGPGAHHHLVKSLESGEADLEKNICKTNKIKVGKRHDYYDADLLGRAEGKLLHMFQQEAPGLGEVAEAVEQRPLGDEHPGHAGNGQHLRL